MVSFVGVNRTVSARAERDVSKCPSRLLSVTGRARVGGSGADSPPPARGAPTGARGRRTERAARGRGLVRVAPDETGETRCPPGETRACRDRPRRRDWIGKSIDATPRPQGLGGWVRETKHAVPARSRPAERPASPFSPVSPGGATVRVAKRGFRRDDAPLCPRTCCRRRCRRPAR